MIKKSEEKKKRKRVIMKFRMKKSKKCSILNALIIHDVLITSLFYFSLYYIIKNMSRHYRVCKT